MMASERECDAASATQTGSFLQRIAPSLEDNEFRQCEKFLSKTGKGRPPKLKIQLPTFRLLLQLELLRQRTKCTWQDVETLFQKSTDGDPLQGLSLRAEVEGVVREGPKITDAGLSAFLNTNLATSIAGRHVGVHLQKYGICRQHLLDPQLLQTLNAPAECTNAMVIDLLFFQKKEPGVKKRTVLEFLGCDTANVSDQVLNKRLKQVYDEDVKLKKSINRESGCRNRNLFLAETFRISPQLSSTSASPRPAYLLTADQQALASAQKTVAGLQRSLEDARQELVASKSEVTVLSAVVKEKSESAAELQRKLQFSTSKVTQITAELEARERALSDMRTTVQIIKASNHYKRLKRREANLIKRENAIVEHEQGGCERKIRELKRTKQQLQKKLSNTKKQLERSHRSSRQKIKQLEQAVGDLVQGQQVHEEPVRVVRLKDKFGHFTPAAKVCIMSLVGECEVPASRCGSIIEAVVRHIIEAHVPQADLPSQRSALRFSDQAHVLSKIHVAEVLKSQDHYDLHTDGTSRSGKKYVCQVVNTQEGAYSLGFTTVAREDSTTLVEVSLQMLEEISDLYPHNEVQDNFLRMLSGLSGVMTDRAAVMKSFGKDLQEERRVLLQSEDGLHFLHCNAHFLLGLSNGIKKVLEAEDKARTATPTGFCKAGECFAYRYVRMACDCLGPRGDDKNGCRDTWQAYCITVAERQSAITSFRENRFNNTFHGAASVHFHREDIQNCLQTYLPTRNNKIQVVLADSKDEMTDCHLVALGLLYFRIAGPYWRLLGCKIHYLDFYKYVADLHSTLIQWQQDPSPALSQECQPVFTGIPFREERDLLQSLLAASLEKASAIKALLQKMCKAMLEVTERQLSDFLPGGKYHNRGDLELHLRLSHSFITNLVAEESFADLDFSLFKRRNCSLHHHSTVAMLKKNKSLTNWFLQQSFSEQQQLLSLSARKAGTLRKQHKQLETAAVRKRKEIMEKERQEREAAEEKREQKVTEIVDTLKGHNGPCTSVEDLDRLLQLYTTKTSLKAALRAEILFQKLVLGKKSTLLVVTGQPLALINRMRLMFGADALEHLPHLSHREGSQSQARKRLRHDEEDSDDREDGGEEESSEEECVEVEKNFKFERAGEMVAVYYVDGFFVGQVVSIESEEEGTVNFLESARGKRGIFRWPSRVDCCPISSAVVFARNLVLAPFSSSGRAFVVESPNNLPAMYQAFKEYLADSFIM